MPLPTLKPFQEPLVKEIREALKTHHSVVLAACPGAGKTIMSLDIMLDYLRAGKIVLVLTHGTKVLLDQWTNRVETFGLAEYLSNGQLILKLPQSKAAIKKLLADKQIALLVVDEAHEFYFAHRLVEGEVKHGTVQQIIKDHKPEKELLLTGTPSKFIYDNQINKSDRPIVICPGTAVFQAGMLQDTYFGMVKSAYNFRMNYEKLHDEDDEEGSEKDTSDFNGKGDLKQTLYIDPKQTRDSLVNLVAAMIERLSLVSAAKSSINVANAMTYLPPMLRSWASVFGTLEKTMIAAHSIEQAKALRDVLEEQFEGSDARVILSVSKGMSADPDDIDEDGKNITAFQSDPKIKVLIVVRRGILGFDMFDLCNVVDFTCSRNINRIYQLYARVLRAHSGHDKFFFRVASSENPSIDSFFLQAALCLNNKDFLSRFNGKNLSVMDVIVPRNRKLSERKRGPGKGRPVVDSVTPVDALMYWEILNLELMTEMSVNSDSPYWKEFEKVKFGQVMSKLTDKVFMDPEGMKEAILDFCRTYGRRPRVKAK